MIIRKLLKTFLFFSSLGGSVLFFVRGGSTEKHCASNISIHDIKNNASKIKYSFEIKNGTLSISADEVNFECANIIRLHSVNAIYTARNKRITIYTEECTYEAKHKKVYLKNNITIKSDDMIVRTNNATIDINEQNIQSKSKTFGSSNNIHFTCSGFIVNRDGVIYLTNAKTSHKMKK